MQIHGKYSIYRKSGGGGGGWGGVNTIKSVLQTVSGFQCGSFSRPLT